MLALIPTIAVITFLLASIALICIGYAFPIWYGFGSVAPGHPDHPSQDGKITLAGSSPFGTSPDAAALLKAIEDGYAGTGAGVLMSSVAFKLSADPVIDGSGSIVKNRVSTQLDGVNDENAIFTGYVWNPVDNLKTITCTYVSDANTIFRVADPAKGSRCAYELPLANSRPTQLYPIMCSNPQHPPCTSSTDCYSKTTTVSKCPVGISGMRCPEDLCDAGQDCVECMLAQSKTNQAPYPNGNFPVITPEVCPNCSYNEVVFADSILRPEDLKTVQASIFFNKPGPSGIVIGIPRKRKFELNETLCSDLFPSGLFDWLKTKFVSDTVIILIRCNATIQPGSTDKDPSNIQDLMFVEAFPLKDIDTKICKV